MTYYSTLKMGPTISPEITITARIHVTSRKTIGLLFYFIHVRISNPINNFVTTILFPHILIKINMKIMIIFQII